MDCMTTPSSAILKRLKTLEKRESALKKEINRLRNGLKAKRDGFLGHRDFTLMGFASEYYRRNKLNTIKMLRMTVRGLGLREAKDIVDSLEMGRTQNIEFPYGINTEELRMLTEAFEFRIN